MEYLLFSAVGAPGKYAVKDIIKDLKADIDTDKDESEKGTLSKVLSSPGVASFRGRRTIDRTNVFYQVVIKIRRGQGHVPR
jgi:hypothetical protein